MAAAQRIDEADNASVLCGDRRAMQGDKPAANQEGKAG